jgi:hypothetical protein
VVAGRKEEGEGVYGLLGLLKNFISLFLWVTRPQEGRKEESFPTASFFSRDSWNCIRKYKK